MRPTQIETTDRFVPLELTLPCGPQREVGCKGSLLTAYCTAEEILEWSSIAAALYAKHLDLPLKANYASSVETKPLPAIWTTVNMCGPIRSRAWSKFNFCYHWTTPMTVSCIELVIILRHSLLVADLLMTAPSTRKPYAAPTRWYTTKSHQRVLTFDPKTSQSGHRSHPGGEWMR